MRFFFKNLTKATHHYVDFSRIGNLIAGQHRYTTKELIVRGSIIVCIAVPAFLGAYLNNEDKTGCSNVAMSIALGVIGFAVSHTVAVYPLIMKRCDRSKECDQLAVSIHEKLRLKFENSKEFKELENLIQRAIQHIFSLSLSDEKHGNASQTWGRRKRLLSKMDDCLNQTKEEIRDFWKSSDDMTVIMKKLMSDTPNVVQMKASI